MTNDDSTTSETTAAAAATTPPGRATLFLCGDVMPGRGIDQIFARHSDPRLFEQYVKSATTYVDIAERANGPIPRAVEPAYIWGDVLSELEQARPDLRIVNLETAVTTSDDAWPDKGIHYRMHPANASCLAAAGLDCCVIANNHVLDWGYAGLAETTATLHRAGLRTAGAGRNAREAAAPAVVELSGGGRVVVVAYGSPSAGVPAEWAATDRRAGVNWLDETAQDAADRIARDVGSVKRPGDIVVASIHWGSNWGYEVTAAQRALAHRLVERAGVDVLHGHSSHHPRPIEVHRGKLILYGCGDFLNDYEGIGGYESFRPELTLMYLPELDRGSGRLERLRLVPMRIRKFRVNRATVEEADWLLATLSREGRAFGTRIQRADSGALELSWD